MNFIFEEHDDGSVAVLCNGAPYLFFKSRFEAMEFYDALNGFISKRLAV